MLSNLTRSHYNAANKHRNILDNKLKKFRYNLAIECWEHSLKFPISAHHCLMSTGIIPKHYQASYMIVVIYLKI